MTARPRLQQLHQSGATDGQIAAWDDGLGLWIPVDAAAATSLAGLSDVDTTGVADGDALVYDSGTSTWLPGTAGSGGGGGVVGIDDLTTFDGIYGSALSYDCEFSATSSSLPSGWAWVNQGSSTYNEANGRAELIATQSGGSVSGNERHRMITRSFPSESTWTCYAKVQALGATSAWLRWGLVMRLASSGKYYVLHRALQDSNDTAKVEYWSALNTFGSSASSTALGDKSPYFRIKKNSTTSFDYAVSLDGIVWHTILAANNPTGNVASFDEIGFLFSCNDSKNMTASIDWFRIR